MSRKRGKNGENKMNYKIVADSAADTPLVFSVPFCTVPLKISTDSKEYVDDSGLDVHEMLSDLEKYKGRSRTACPSVGEYLKAFEGADRVFCVTITSGLSGSYNAAVVAATQFMEENPGSRVCVIDSLSTGPENALIVEKIAELIGEGKDFEEIRAQVIAYKKRTRLVFILESLHNLANNGRVSPLVAKVAGILGIKIIGKASDEGTLEIKKKSRGAKNVLIDVLRIIKGEGFKGGRVKIHHAENLEQAEIIKEKLLEDSPEAKIEISQTRGLCSFYAERGGVLLGFEVE